MKFLIDENVHHGLVPFLKGLNHALKSSLKRLLAEKLSQEALADKLFLLFENTHEEIPFRFEEFKP